MPIPDGFIDNLPDNVFLATRDLAREIHVQLELRGIPKLNDRLIDDLAFYAAFRDHAKISEKVNTPFKFPDHAQDTITAKEYLGLELEFLENYASSLHKLDAASKAANRVREYFEKKQGIEITYEFTDKEYGDLQEKLNQFRDSVRDSEEITEAHKIRILRKVEKVQTELHKKITATESLYGIVIDAAVIAKKYGPQVVRVWTIGQAIFNIITEVVKRAEDITGAFYLEPPIAESEKKLPEKIVDISED